jgi:hypothetical protein
MVIESPHLLKRYSDMGFHRSKNYMVKDTKLSATQAFGAVAGIAVISASLSAGITKAVVQEVVEKEVPVVEYRDLPENRDLIYVYENERFKPEDNFKIVFGNCVLTGETAYEASYNKQEDAITELRQAMSSGDFENSVAASGEKVTKAIRSLRLECVTPSAP